MDLLYIGHIGLKGSRRISNEQVVKKITHCQDKICEMQLSLGKLNSLTPETPRSAVQCSAGQTKVLYKSGRRVA